MSTPETVEEYIAKQRAAVAQNPECGTSHYNLAVGLLGQKKYDEAEREFLEAIECSPSLAEAYVQLGGIYLQRGDLDGLRELDCRLVQLHDPLDFLPGLYGQRLICVAQIEPDRSVPKERLPAETYLL